MDAVFSLPEAARAHFLQSILQSSGCSYICLWSYDSLLSNRLLCLDGLFNVRINQPSTSLGSSVAQRLFDQYRSLLFDVNDNNRIPGLAFKNRSYLELQQPDLLRLAWTPIQTQFYQEARIKTAVFMGCNNGEMEFGFPNMSQDDIHTTLRNWFPDEFSRSNQQQPNIDQSQNQNQNQNQNPPSSSSSSLRSLSLSAGSPEYSSLLFNIPVTSSPHFPPPPPLAQVTAQSPFPTPDSENEAIMRAILHVLSTTTNSSTSPSSLPQNLPNTNNYMVHPEASAFKRYSPNGIIPPPRPPLSQMGPDHQLRRQSLFKRSLTFFRGLNFMRMRERIQTSRPSTTQLHHMISERRRREKLNENFQNLRSLLPPGTKKDKASILTTAKEVLSSLMAEIEKLRERNKQLEGTTITTSSSMAAAPAAVKETSGDDDHEIVNERLNVRISSSGEQPPESSSSSEEGRMVDLEVTVRGQNSQVDILIRLLGFLKQDQSLSLISMEANTQIAHATSFNRISVRLRVEASEWDESAFQEAVRRVVAELAQ